MAALLMEALPLLALFGAVAVVIVVLLVAFWPVVEWQLLCWLQNRRKARESAFIASDYVAPKVTRLAVRKPR